jgi:hypothetical protein
MVEIDDGKAAAVDGDAVRNDQRWRDGWCVNAHAATVGLEVEGLDRAEMFDDSGEHF